MKSPNGRPALLTFLFALLLVALAYAALAQASAATPPPRDTTGGLLFIENVGQFPADARFQVHGAADVAWLAQDAIWLTGAETAAAPSRVPQEAWLPPVVRQHFTAPQRSVAVALSFAGANNAAIEPFAPQATAVSYFLGAEPTQRFVDVPVWGGVRYVDLYPHLDLVLASRNGRFHPYFVCKPGCEAALAQVRLHVAGATGVTVQGEQLAVETAVAPLSFPLPAVVDEQGRAVAHSDFTVVVDGVEVAAPFARPTPQTQRATAAGDGLRFSTYLGGSEFDEIHDLAVDGAGSVYVAGTTNSNDFPTTPGAFDTRNDEFCFRGVTRCREAFVARLSADGRQLLYATYLGGSDNDYGNALALDGAGNAYVAGFTESADFPVTAGAYDTTFAGDEEVDNDGDAFVLKLNAEGTDLVYATYLGGAPTYDGPDYGGGFFPGGRDVALAVALDEAQNAYVAGMTESPEFPTTAAFGSGAGSSAATGICVFRGATFPCGDGFVAALSADGADLLYGATLHGASYDQANDVALGGEGEIYLTGVTGSADFPTTAAAFDASFNGGNRAIVPYAGLDAFVVKVDGADLLYGSYVGGSSDDAGRALALDGLGQAVVAGETWSADFPATAQAYDPGYNGGRCAFEATNDNCPDMAVFKLDAAGAALRFATYIGGGSDDATESARALALGSAGSIFVGGYANDPTFPTTADAYRPVGTGPAVFQLSADGAQLRYSTFLDDEDDGYVDLVEALALDDAGQPYLAGSTDSATYPVTAGAFDIEINGRLDGFVTKMQVATAVPPTATPPPPSPTPARGMRLIFPILFNEWP